MQNRGLILGDTVGRQPALALAQAHAAARTVKTHADGLRGGKLVVQPAAVGPEIVVVAGRGAAGQEQLGQRKLCADKDIVGRQLRPDGVECLEPVEEYGILRGGDNARVSV
jgi:hypothetical protein